MGEVTNEHRIGDLSARVAILERGQQTMRGELRTELRDMRKMLSDMHEIVTSAKGSWKAVVFIGSAFVAVTTAAAAVGHWFIK